MLSVIPEVAIRCIPLRFISENFSFIAFVKSWNGNEKIIDHFVTNSNIDLTAHFIPKFVFDWIKKTSATGYLRQAININKRLQDGAKEKFLCLECENKFSK